MSDERLNPVLRRVEAAHAAVEELKTFVDCCRDGIWSAAEANKRVDLAVKIGAALSEPLHDDAVKRRRERAEKFERFSQPERDSGFPYLFGLATVRLWTILEATVDDVAADMIDAVAETVQLPAFSRLKGPLVPFLTGSSSERVSCLVELLKGDVAAPLRPGIVGFEALLEAIGLSGQVDATIKKSLLELSAVRNSIIHRQGIADARLLARCPWLPLKVGERVEVRDPEFGVFFAGSIAYLRELRRRIHVRAGESEAAGRIELQLAKLVEILSDLYSGELSCPVHSPLGLRRKALVETTD